MHGNANTWCNDRLGPGLLNRILSSSRNDPRTLRPYGEKVSRALRGGTFNDQPSILRAAHRDYSRPGDRVIPVGFRVARTCRGGP